MAEATKEKEAELRKKPISPWDYYRYRSAIAVKKQIPPWYGADGAFQFIMRLPYIRPWFCREYNMKQVIVLSGQHNEYSLAD
jgi:hypothetical protein